MINKETVRIGAIKTEEEAARIYDILAILTEGLSVSKPNIFTYFFSLKLTLITMSSKWS